MAVPEREGRSFASPEGWLASIVQSSRDAIVAEADSGIVSWNPGAEQLYGWSRAEMLGKPLSTLAAPERTDEMTRALSRVRRLEKVENFQTVHVRKDRVRVAVSATISPVFDSGGTLLGVSLIARDVSERAYAEERLQKSEERYRELVEQASDAIFIAGMDGRYREVNPAACELLGARREDIVGLTIMDLLPPDDLTRLREARTRLLAEPGRRETAEWRLRRKDGSYVAVEISTRILSDGRWQAIARDISTRKAAEAKLARAIESERKVRARLEAVESATAAISEAILKLPETDLRAVLTTVLEQAQTLTSARYAAVGVGSDPQRGFDPFVHRGMTPVDEAIIGAAPRPVGTLGLVARGELVRIADLSQHAQFRGMPNGHAAMKSLLGVPIRHREQVVGNLYLADKNGGEPFDDEDVRTVELLAQRVGVAVLIARLYHGELEGRSFLQAVVDQMPEGVVVLDAAGKMTHCNRAAMALSTGPSGQVDEFGNAMIFDLRTPSGAPLPFGEIPAVRAMREKRRLNGIEVAVMAPGGRLVPLLVNVAPLRNARGEAAGAVALFKDITADKELQRVRDEWISVIAHDLRQPVNAVSVSTHNLAKLRAGQQAGREEEIVASLRSSVAALDRLLDDLLDVAVIGAHRLQLERVTGDAFRLIDAAVTIVRGTFPEAEIVERFSGDPVSISVDPHRLRQVIGNLVSNAIKYGTPGAPILVHGEGRPSGAIIEVVNQGRGIEPADLDRIFKPFVRSSATQHEGVPGLGLGLYICRGIVEAHGGSISAESVLRGSTVIRIALPAA